MQSASEGAAKGREQRSRNSSTEGRAKAAQPASMWEGCRVEEQQQQTRHGGALCPCKLARSLAVQTCGVGLSWDGGGDLQGQLQPGECGRGSGGVPAKTKSQKQDNISMRVLTPRWPCPSPVYCQFPLGAPVPSSFAHAGPCLHVYVAQCWPRQSSLAELFAVPAAADYCSLLQPGTRSHRMHAALKAIGRDKR